MAIPVIAASVLSVALRQVVITFLVKSSIVVINTLLIPFLINTFVMPFMDLTSLTAVFNSLSPEMWFILDLFKFDFGIPLLISAVVARFLIRRLPFVG